MEKGFKRKENIREEYKIIYIFTEGEKTEPIYFKFKKKEIRRNNIKIIINEKTKEKRRGRPTINLVNFVLNFVEIKNINLENDECWVVFDKDDFKNFNDAIIKAESNNLKVAYSNECFELWFLLHFNYMSSAIGRSDYNKKITENYRNLTGDKEYKYNKNKGLFSLIEIIKDRELEAIKNAKNLLLEFKDEESFLKKDPSTTVHLLVEELNKLK